jgi:hypothetical protein
VTALIRTDRDAVGIFLNGRAHNVVDAAIVAKVDNFDALRLYEAAHDIDRRIMPIEQRRGRHKS